MKRLCSIWLIVVALLVLVNVLVAFSPPAAAVDPSEMLEDPKLEARARALSAELRCVVCQNQSIDDSDAPLAKDLRRLVRERLVAGDSDAGVKDYLVARYGTFVLLKPPVNQRTILLWILPFLLTVVALVVVYRSVFRGPRAESESSGQTVETLTPDEQERLENLLHKGASDHGGKT